MNIEGSPDDVPRRRVRGSTKQTVKKWIQGWRKGYRLDRDEDDNSQWCPYVSAEWMGSYLVVLNWLCLPGDQSLYSLWASSIGFVALQKFDVLVLYFLQFLSPHSTMGSNRISRHKRLYYNMHFLWKKLHFVPRLEQWWLKRNPAEKKSSRMDFPALQKWGGLFNSHPPPMSATNCK